MRTKARLNQMQSSITQKAKTTGISAAVKLAVIAPQAELVRNLFFDIWCNCHDFTLNCVSSYLAQLENESLLIHLLISRSVKRFPKSNGGIKF